MDPFYLECELVHPVTTYFKEQGYKVKEEMKIGFYRADLVCRKKDKLVAVELKLRDYKKAIAQAKNYQLGVSYVYVAFPLFKVSNVLRKREYLLRKEGIGLLVVNEQSCEVKEIIEPQQSQRLFLPLEF